MTKSRALEIKNLLTKASAGFKTLAIGENYQTQALAFLEQWLSDPMFQEYVPQIAHLIEKEYWDYLIDCFYKVIPFGTGGRRGEVGVGPNRINPWTITASAQGHSQYLLKQYGEESKTRGVVITYDVRQFYGNKYLNNKLQNPVLNVSCKHLAEAAAEVYAANGIKVYMFNDIRTTPQLSFSIRYLHAVGGTMISASHNPPEHNGKKVFDDTGGQLVPPDDEKLVDEVTKSVKEIKRLAYKDAHKQKIIVMAGADVDEAYIQAASACSLSTNREAKIVFSPLHGCGTTSVSKALEKLGFNFENDPQTSNPSGRFEHVTFNIPNPEVQESFDTPLIYAKKVDADILISSDPDADRFGMMVKHNGEWKFLNGNEIAAIIGEYVIQKRKGTLTGQGIVIKTEVTTNLIREICKKNNIKLIGDLLVGYKYIGVAMNNLQTTNEMENFLFGCEESHGYNTGDYTREKDAVPAAIWMSELAGELKKQGRTLVDYLDEIYAHYGFFRNYLTEIRMLGAIGNEKINQIQKALRANPPKTFAEFSVDHIEDFQDRKPIVSETDKISKNVLAFHFKPVAGTISMKCTVRPSGTEPKIKMYFEIGALPTSPEDIPLVKEKMEQLLQKFEKAFMKTCYNIIGTDFPDRGFLLFWQLPLDSKMQYFNIEPKIAELQNETSIEIKKRKLTELLAFLGSNPIEKVDKAFAAQYGASIAKYIGI